MDTADAVSLVFSFIALTISGIVAIVECKRDYRINRLNMESEYFSDIYKDFLVKKVPTARKKLHFERNQLVGIDELIKTLKDIRQDSLYFEFRNKDFYDGLKTKLQRLEDYLFEIAAGGTLDTYKQEIFFKQINTDIKSIYDYISKAHFGEK